jgi:hypothetical protein
MSGLMTRNRPVTLTARVAALGILALLGTAACNRDQVHPVGQPDLGTPLHRPANFDPTLPGLVACSTKVLEGDVVRVVDGRPGRMLATVAVDHWVKPATGPRQVQLDLVDIAKEGVYQRWSPGTRLRLVVDADPSSLPEWQFPADEFTAIERAAPRAARLDCPYGPR